MFKKLKNNQGFTLIELIVAMSVMALVFSAVGGLLNRRMPDLLSINLLNDESQYARAVTQLLVREIKKSNTGLPESFKELRQNKKPVLGKDSIVASVIILDDNNQDRGKRIWIASEKGITNKIEKPDEELGVKLVKEEVKQPGKIYSVSSDGLLVYQDATRTIKYEIKIKDNEITKIFLDKVSESFAVDTTDKDVIIAVAGTKNRIESLIFTRNKPNTKPGSFEEVFDSVYNIKLVMSTKDKYEREYKYETIAEACVSPLVLRPQIVSGNPSNGTPLQGV